MKSVFLIIGLLYLFSSCAYKNTKEDVKQYKNELVQDVFPYHEKYSWSFQLMGKTQVSTHAFFRDSIVYDMKGKIHSTNYSIRKLSYNALQNKWIGESPDKVVYTLFFKDKTDSTITIYKHKCKTNGLEEAINFSFPKDEATEDHGWNIYTLKGFRTEDLLQISNHYSNELNSLFISDKIVVINDKQVKKMSFHSGERRWVGKYKNNYLLVFFKELKNEGNLSLSIKWFNDLEQLYKTKYNTINNWKNYEKK